MTQAKFFQVFPNRNLKKICLQRAYPPNPLYVKKITGFLRPVTQQKRDFWHNFRFIKVSIFSKYVLFTSSDICSFLCYYMHIVQSSDECNFAHKKSRDFFESLLKLVTVFSYLVQYLYFIAIVN